MWQLIKDIVSGAAAFCRFKEKKQELVNSPEMQANAGAQTTAAITADATNAVATRDAAAVEKGLAE